MRLTGMKAAAGISGKKARRKKERPCAMTMNTLMCLPGNIRVIATGNYIKRNWSLKWPSQLNAVTNNTMRYFLGIILIFMTGVVSGQTVLSKIPASGASYSAFVPAGYDTLAVTRGDLNNDKLEDLALVLKSVKENDRDADPNVEPPGRLLV